MDGGVISLRLFTDENPYMDGLFVTRLTHVVEKLKEDASVHAIVIEGGTRYFSAGASHEGLVTTDPELSLLPKVAEIPRLVLSLPLSTLSSPDDIPSPIPHLSSPCHGQFAHGS